MLLGEGQILAQVKTAIAEARLHGTAGPLLPTVFEKATAAATRIRERVGMEKRSLSLGSTALRLAEEALGNLEGKNVLLIGTGQVGTLVMKALTSMNVRNVAVSSRSLKSVEAFTRILGGRLVSMREIPSYLASYDLVVIATKGSEYLLTKDTIKAALPQAGSRKLVVLDLSSHPNVSPDITELEGVTLKTLEDTRRIVDSTSGPATELLREAEPFVKVEVESILRELRLGKSEPFMAEKSEKLMLEAATQIF
jgi:glutamyl-tRNA reductase